ncbi:uracil-DNA glycosylase [Pseudonocardia sp. MH-G8]|uniref:uracil-DNA glycosylase n=1 Tax=Pseudonocardia sp. MH-G8 TaxID=1854588 RepID=UPI00130444A0|nr:uracil-DNA glycosylase [Pseudonocardia sp. MH-G8]
MNLDRHQRMRDADFRADQHSRLRDPHIAPFTDLVDELRAEPGRGWMPYIAPMYGGINASILSVLQDPGPGTREADGSGMLCCENVDDSAMLLATLLESTRIPVSELLPWNGYPWYRHTTGKSVPPSATECEAGVEPLRRLIDLAPNLRIVMLHGGIAQDVWARFGKRHRSIARRFHVVPTFHTGRQAFIGTHEIRTVRLRHLYESFAEVGDLIRKEDVA